MDVDTFVTRYAKDPARLRSVLKYGEYYHTLDLSGGEFLAVQILAEFEPIGHILKEWPHDKVLRFIAFIFRKPREGTFKALSQFDARYKTILSGLRRFYYDVEHVDKGEEFLELDAQEKTRQLFTELTSLVQMLATGVDELYSHIVELLDRLNDPVSKEGASQQWKRIKDGLGSFIRNAYTYDDFLKFTRLFGLYAYPSIFPGSPSEPTALLEKVQNLKAIVTGLYGLKRGLNTVVVEDFQYIISFVLSITAHLDATIKNPSLYTEGIHYFTCSIATYNKLLEQEGALEALVAAYKKIGNCDVPIVIFDQSDDEVFDKNSLYVRSLAYPIIHISKNLARELAKKLGVESLIITTPEGNFGYGGARNCQFIFTGVARAVGDVQKLSDITKDTLKRLFKEHSRDRLLLIDDDMSVDETNLLSCALVAKDLNIAAQGYQYGRASKYVLFYWNLPDVLNDPSKIKMFPEWIDFTTNAGYSEQLMKPGICLNLPQGNEELHVKTMVQEHLFLKPAYHLSGPRYPMGEFPTKHFVGLDRYLKKSLSHVLLICLTEFLLSPSGVGVQTALPWNELPYGLSLQELPVILQQWPIVTMRFWQHMREFFCDKKREYAPFLDMIDAIRTLDVDATIRDYQERTELTAEEDESLRKLGDVYKAIQKDVEEFWQLGCMLSKDPNYAFTIADASLPLTQGLCLTVNSIARDGFKNGVRSLL